MSTATDYYDHYKRINPSIEGGGDYGEEFYPILPTRKYLPILEVGSGYGSFLEYLIKLGYQCIHTIDRSLELNKFVNSKLGNRLSLSKNIDVSTFLEDVEEFYEAIVLIDVVEHIKKDDSRKILQQIYKALKDGGRLIIRTPNMANLLGCYSRYIDITHETGYTEFSLTQLLKEVGFNQVAIHTPTYRLFSARWFYQKLIYIIHRLLYRIEFRTMPTNFQKNLILYSIK